MSFEVLFEVMVEENSEIEFGEEFDKCVLLNCRVIDGNVLLRFGVMVDAVKLVEDKVAGDFGDKLEFAKFEISNPSKLLKLAVGLELGLCLEFGVEPESLDLIFGRFVGE